MAADIMEPKIGNFQEELSKAKQSETSSTETESAQAETTSDNKMNYIKIAVYSVIAIATIWAMRTGRMARPFLAGFLVGASLIGIVNSTSSIIKSTKTA